MKDEVVTSDELQILLNLVDEVSVMYPLYSRFKFFEAKPEGEGYKLSIKQGEMDFERQ